MSDLLRGELKRLKRAMIVYKAAWKPGARLCTPCIVKLRIPAGARVVLFNGPTLNTRKCRADRAEVLSITFRDRRFQRPIKVAESDYTSQFVYTVGETVRPSHFSRSTKAMCAGGIHFFRNEKDARAYMW